MIVREHRFPSPGDEVKCDYCGDPQKIAKDRSCVSREVPRATPPSMFAGDISYIGEAAKELRAKEDAAWQAASK